MNLPTSPSLQDPGASMTPALQLYRKRPAIVQSLDYRPGSLEVTLFWNAPQDMRGVDKWRIYRDNENNLVQEVADRDARQTVVKLSAGEQTYFYVCAVSKFNLEGPKRGVLVQSNSEQLLVVTGTSGATPGTPSKPDPGWSQQPSGGGKIKPL